MSKSLSDADLDAGLDEAKKKPRYFAIITKGQTIVKMIVQKKRVKDGDIQFAKREFKGNAAITGVCTRSGAELFLQVENEEPTLKAIKVKEFIVEQTGAMVKPQWQVVAALATVADDDDFDVPPAVKKDYDPLEPATLGRAPPEVRSSPVEYADIDLPKKQVDHSADIDLRKSGDVQSPRAEQPPVAPPPVQPVVPVPPVAPPQATAGPNTKNGKVRAALEKAMPKINLAIKNFEQPGSNEKPISERLARILALLDDTTRDQSDLAMSAFRELVALIAPLLENRGAVPKDENQSQRLVKLQQSRKLWDMARQKLHKKLKSVAAAVEQECQNPDEYDQADVKKKVELLDGIMEQLDERLIDVLDQALNAKLVEDRSSLEEQAVQIVAEYLRIVDTDPLVSAIDESGLIDTPIKPSLSKLLTELSARLSA